MESYLSNCFLKLPTNLLGIFAHEDDEVIGAGGTLAKNAKLGGKSHIICFGGKDRIRRDELDSACNNLGITYETEGYEDEHFESINKGDARNKLRDLVINNKPEFVLTHRRSSEYNSDHHVVYDLARSATIKAQNPMEGWKAKGLLYTETHSPHEEWHIMVDITDQYEKAYSALEKHVSQMKKVNDYYLQLYDARTKMRGVQAGCERAEAFVLEPLPLIGGLNRKKFGV